MALWPDYDDTEVHNTHCCHRCGCKYGDENCPVANGKVSGIARSECDYCEHDSDIDAEEYIKSLRESRDRLLSEVHLFCEIARIESPTTQLGGWDWKGIHKRLSALLASIKESE